MVCEPKTPVKSHAMRFGMKKMDSLQAAPSFAALDLVHRTPLGYSREEACAPYDSGEECVQSDEPRFRLPTFPPFCRGFKNARVCQVNTPTGREAHTLSARAVAL